MKTELEVFIESDYNHDNKFEETRQKIENAAFYVQSLFKVIKMANTQFETISDDGVAKDAQDYIEDLNNLCEVGSGLAFSVFREASNFSLYVFNEKDGQTIVSEMPPIYTGKPEVDELAVMLSNLLNHSALPKELYENLSNGITDFFNQDIDQSATNEFHDSPEYLAKVLDGYVDLSEEDER